MGKALSVKSKVILGEKTIASRARDKRVADVHLRARLLSGQETEFTLLSSATMWQLCSKIQSGLDVPAHQLKLVHKGALLHVQFQKSLDEVGIEDGDFFEVINIGGAVTPEDISPRGLRNMLAFEGIEHDKIQDMDPPAMIKLLIDRGWCRSDSYALHSKMEDVEGVHIEFLNILRGKVASECVTPSQWFGGHRVKLFSPLEVPDALNFLAERCGGGSLKSACFVLQLADGSRYIHGNYPLRYQAAESDDAKDLESCGLVEVVGDMYSPGLTRGNTWWLLPTDQPMHEKLMSERVRAYKVHIQNYRSSMLAIKRCSHHRIFIAQLLQWGL